MDRDTLASCAHSKLVRSLTVDYGNRLSPMHSAALMELVDCFAGFAFGEEQGRKAFGLPTGTGKTTAIVAFIAALEELGLVVPVAVSAGKVEALCELKRDLIAAGVAPERIGIKHSHGADATEPSTGNEDRLYQLVTHARIRTRNREDVELFTQHKGKPRALMVYDESCLRADSLGIEWSMLRVAIAAMSGDTLDGAGPDALAYLQQCGGLIAQALQQPEERPGAGVDVQTPERPPEVIAGYIEATRRLRIQANAQPLRDFLEISQEPLRVLKADGNRDGLVWCREAVPHELRNMVILDASHPIRKLAQMDPSVQQMGSYRPVDIKTFEAVRIHQLLAGGGRSSMSKRYSARDGGEAAAEVVRIIREHWDTARAVLVFTFKHRGGSEVDQQRALAEAVRRAGMDPEAKTPEGKGRLCFLSWGSETSLNSFRHCDVVILAGVLHRSYPDIAAAIKGQRGNLATPTPATLIREVIDSEVAHLVLQAASRGSCRGVTDGKAHPMSLYFIHCDAGVRRHLDVVMPGAQWLVSSPVHMKGRGGIVAEMAGRIVEHLLGVPSGVPAVSSRQLKRAMGIDPEDKAAEQAFTRAAKDLTSAVGWVKTGRGFERMFSPA